MLFMPFRPHSGGHITRFFTVGGLLVIAIFQSAYAQQPRNYAATGGGTRSCAEFAEAYKQYPADTEGAFFIWAQGMMSGINFVLSIRNQDTTNLARWELQRQMQHIRQYCANNPLRYYLEAVVDLYDTMRREQYLSDWRR
jgi:hypothetical protein